MKRHSSTCLHALREPLTYEPYKLINVADIIGYTEKHIKKPDWTIIKERWPLLFNALPLMQHVSPWNRQKVSEEIIAPVKEEGTVNISPFEGWPQRRLKDFRANGLGWGKVLKDTFLPPM